MSQLAFTAAEMMTVAPAPRLENGAVCFVAIALPGLIGSGEEAFRLAFAGWTLALAAAVVLLCGALAARTGGDRRRALLAAALMPLLCGALVQPHWGNPL